MKKSPLLLTILTTCLLGTTGLYGLGSMSIGYESRHIYRGVDSALDGSIQWSAIQVEQAGAYGGLWYGTGAATEYEEVDLYGGYVYQAGDWRLIPNFIWYHFPDNDSADSTDVQLWIERDWVLESGIVLRPQLKARYNLDVEGTFFTGDPLSPLPPGAEEWNRLDGLVEVLDEERGVIRALFPGTARVEVGNDLHGFSLADDGGPEFGRTADTVLVRIGGR